MYSRVFSVDLFWLKNFHFHRALSFFPRWLYIFFLNYPYYVKFLINFLIQYLAIVAQIVIQHILYAFNLKKSFFLYFVVFKNWFFSDQNFQISWRVLELRAEKVGVLYENDIFEVKTNSLKKPLKHKFLGIYVLMRVV